MMVLAPNVPFFCGWNEAPCHKRILKMPITNLQSCRLTGRDLDFLVKIAAPGVKNKHKLKQIIREDEDFRNSFSYPSSGEIRPQVHGNIGLSPEDYHQEGQKFYRLAAEHPSAQELDISDVFWDLHANFQMVKKPLNFIAEHYLHYQRHQFFG
jgi:hypothetical protein